MNFDLDNFNEEEIRYLEHIHEILKNKIQELLELHKKRQHSKLNN